MGNPVRLTLSEELGDSLDGAWWPYTSAIARELGDLIDALRERLGNVNNIDVNWSPVQGVADLDSLHRRGGAATVGQNECHLRVMTITGSAARAHLLVVPCRTSSALAVMLLRLAAGLSIVNQHQNTPAFHTAGAIVQSARVQVLPTAAPTDNSG